MSQERIVDTIDTLTTNCSTKDGMRIFIEKDNKEFTLITHTKTGIPIHIDLKDLLEECVGIGLIAVGINVGQGQDELEIL